MSDPTEGTATGPRERGTSQQFAFLLAEAAVLLGAGAVLYLLISRYAGSELLGQYSVTLAWIMLFHAAGSFGIPEFVMRETARRFEDRARYVSHALQIGAATSIVATAVLAASVALLVEEGPMRRALLTGAAGLTPLMLMGICRGTFLAHHRAEYAFGLAALEYVLVLPVSTWMLLSGVGVEGLIAVVIAGKMIAAAAWLIALRALVPLKWGFDRSFARPLVRPGVAFGISSCLGLLAMRLNLLMLPLWADLSTVGLYAAASKLVELTVVIPNLFAQLLLPRLAMAFARTGREGLRASIPALRLLLSITLPLAMGVGLFAPTLLELLFGNEFVAAAPVLRILMLFLVIESVDAVLGVFLKAAERQELDVRVFATNPLANALLNLVLVPWLGAIGAAAAKVAGSLCSFGLRRQLVASELIRPGWLRLAAFPALASVLLAGAAMALAGVLPTPAAMVFYGLGAVAIVGHALERETLRAIWSRVAGSRAATGAE